MYYLGYANRNDFSGNLGSVFLNGKDITNTIISRDSYIRFGKTLDERNYTENQICLLTIKELLSKNNDITIATNKEYLVNVVNGRCKARKNKEIIEEVKQLYKESNSCIIYERY